MFKEFSNFIDNDAKENLETNNKIKDKLIKSILVMSRNGNNEMMDLALEMLKKDELKYKLITYI